MLLAAVELLGAALFAFETPLVAGWALLMASFGAGGLVHLQYGEMGWWRIHWSPRCSGAAPCASGEWAGKH